MGYLVRDDKTNLRESLHLEKRGVDAPVETGHMSFDHKSGAIIQPTAARHILRQMQTQCGLNS